MNLNQFRSIDDPFVSTYPIDSHYDITIGGTYNASVALSFVNDFLTASDTDDTSRVDAPGIITITTEARTYRFYHNTFNK